MRILYKILIAATFTQFTYAKNSVQKISITEARGLEEGKCYEEIGALSCDKTCVVDFFPTTQGQISLPVEKISETDRKKFGRIFDIFFQISNKKIVIINLSPIADNKIQDKLKKSSGFFKKAQCKKQ